MKILPTPECCLPRFRRNRLSEWLPCLVARWLCFTAPSFSSDLQCVSRTLQVVPWLFGFLPSPLGPSNLAPSCFCCVYSLAPTVRFFFFSSLAVLAAPCYKCSTHLFMYFIFSMSTSSLQRGEHSGRMLVARYFARLQDSVILVVFFGMSAARVSTNQRGKVTRTIVTAENGPSDLCIQCITEKTQICDQSDEIPHWKNMFKSMKNPRHEWRT